MDVLVVTSKNIMPIHFLSIMLNSSGISHKRQNAKLSNGSKLYGITCSENIDYVYSLINKLDNSNIKVSKLSIDIN